MRQSEIIDWAMRGIIEIMKQEKNEARQVELNRKLKELAKLFVVELQNERK